MKIQATDKGRGELITTQLKFSIKSYKTGIAQGGKVWGFSPLFSSVQLEGLEGTCCSNKGLLLLFNLRHKDDIKFTPASCHVNESKSNNAQGATKQLSPLCSAIPVFNLSIEIPGTEKSQGHFTCTSPRKPPSCNKWLFFWGGCTGR